MLLDQAQIGACWHSWAAFGLVAGGFPDSRAAEAAKVSGRRPIAPPFWGTIGEPRMGVLVPWLFHTPWLLVSTQRHSAIPSCYNILPA